MSVQAVAWAMRQKTGSPTRKAVLIALADRHHRDTGECYPSVALMAEDTELSDRSVRTALEQLVEGGYITRARKRRKDGSLGTYEYELLMETVAAPPAAAAASPPAGRAARNGVDLPNGATSTSTEVAVAAADPLDTPPLVKVQGQNLGFNALRDECRIAEKSPRMIEVATALNGARGAPGIRDMAWAEIRDFKGVGDDPNGWAVEVCIADLIHERAEQYRRAMGDAHLTPLALRKWWVDLPSMQRQQGGAMHTFDVARDEMRRMEHGD